MIRFDVNWTLGVKEPSGIAIKLVWRLVQDFINILNKAGKMIISNNTFCMI